MINNLQSNNSSQLEKVHQKDLDNPFSTPKTGNKINIPHNITESLHFRRNEHTQFRENHYFMFKKNKYLSKSNNHKKITKNVV